MVSMREIKQRKLAAMSGQPATFAGSASAIPAGPAGAGQSGIGQSGIGAARIGPAEQAANLMLIRLTEDRRRLKDIQSAEGKAAAKKIILPEYQAWIDGQLECDFPDGTQNDVLTTIMVWSIDAGEYARALEIADKVLADNIPLPAQFERQAATLIAEEIAEAAFAALRGKTGFDRAIVEQAMELTAEHDMPDEVRAKIFKARAQLLEREAAVLEEAGGEAADGPAGQYRKLLTEGAGSAQRALELDKDCGARTLLRGLERKIAKLPAARSDEDEKE